MKCHLLDMIGAVKDDTCRTHMDKGKIKYKLNSFQSEDPQKGNWQIMQAQIRCHIVRSCKMWCLIKASTVSK